MRLPHHAETQHKAKALLEIRRRAERAKRDIRSWHEAARPEQIAPDGRWFVWLIAAGRGWGKTRSGAEHVCDRHDHESAERLGLIPWSRSALVAPTVGDVRDVLIEGESGILECARRRGMVLRYVPSRREIQWPNGTISKTYSAEKPGRLRGPQHDGAWCDELREWKRGRETWSNLKLGLRLGRKPQVVATTTPLPLSWIVEIRDAGSTVITGGRTEDNLENLAETFQEEIMSEYVGTRTGLQELDAQWLEDAFGALWTRDLIAGMYVDECPAEVERGSVAVDPAMSALPSSDETGIMGGFMGADGNAYVVADRSCRKSPHGWGQQAVNLAAEMDADAIVGERNNGGDMVRETIESVEGGQGFLFKDVWASRGKRARCEPVVARCEQGRVRLVRRWHGRKTNFAELENQMANMTADGYQLDGSPDRLDAFVWLVHDLMIREREKKVVARVV